MSKLVGIKKFRSREGKECCVMCLESVFSKRDIEVNGCLGRKVEEVFLPDGQTLTVKDIGHELGLDYDISGGKAYLVGVTVK